MPRYDDEDDDDFDDRPRRPKPRKKSRKKDTGTRTALIVAGSVVTLLAVAVGVFFVMRSGPANKPKAGDAPAAGAAPIGSAPGGVRYVPRESEKRYMDYRKAQGDRRLTEAEVLAVMGEPTRREPPLIVTRNGMTITVVELHWDVPGSGISSQMTFANGLEAGSVIGLEVTPRK